MDKHSVPITVHRKGYKYTVDIQGKDYPSLMKEIGQKINENVDPLCLVYIDTTLDYIHVSSQDEWAVYLEDRQEGIVDPFHYNDLYVFNDGIEDNGQIISAIDKSIIESFADVGKNEDVSVDKVVREDVIIELAASSRSLPPDVREKIDNSSTVDIHSDPTLKTIIEQEVKKIIDKKIQDGELEYRKAPSAQTPPLPPSIVSTKPKRREDGIKKLKRKGVKIIKKEIKKIEQAAKPVLKAVRNFLKKL